MSGPILIRRGTAPLLLSIPHAGTEIPDSIAPRLVSFWRARKDADWHLPALYDFAAGLGATIVSTQISRTAIDVNRDPSGASLYPGMATTSLCPETTFDGEPLYAPGAAPDDAEIAMRRQAYFDPYHAALQAELARLRASHPIVVLYDAHSIRSVIPRLFEGSLPNFNIGTNDGRSCAPALSGAVAQACAASPAFSSVTNGRFKGGWITRHYGKPEAGVHAVQMELACRGYMEEPDSATAYTWPSPYDPARAAPMREALQHILSACLAFARA